MGRTDRATLLIHAGRAEVFAALVDQEALLTWLPPDGMRGRFERFDMREGGSFRLALTYDDPDGAAGKTSADTDVSEVRITRVVPGERVVQEVAFESDDPALGRPMSMEWTVRSVAEGTEVSVEARDVPAAIGASDHAAGLTSSLANLAAHLEP